MTNSIKNITIIGAGNVGTNLAFAFYKAGLNINCICCRTEANANKIVTKTGAKWIGEFSNLPIDSDLYIIATPDDVIPVVSESIKQAAGIVVHTSGTTDIDALNRFSRRGVFYPLQTFSKIKLANFVHLPICIESKNEEDEMLLNELALKLTDNVHLIDSVQRRKLHLAAVFMCNFVNYMYILGDDYLAKENINSEILNPLIKETVIKALKSSPKNNQTGPARRGDKKTMDMHLNLLSENERYSVVYSLLSKQISEYFQDI